MGTKWLLQSKTVWGILLVAVPSLLTTFGVSIPAEWVGDIDGIVKTLLEVSGSILALYGRITADSGLHILPK